MKTQEHRVIFTCPACDKEVRGTVVSELEMTKVDAGGFANYRGKIIGLSINHDCIPRTPRGRAVRDNPQA